MQEASNQFAEALAGSPAEDYLAKRGIGPQTAAGLRLGYVDPSSDETPSGFERFRGRLAIPNINTAGTVVFLKFRAIHGEEPKYDSPAGYETRLYNLNALNYAGTTLALAEGETDVISLTALGIPAVGIPGANNWKPHHWRCLEGFDRLVMFYDRDAERPRKNKRTGETEMVRVGEELLKTVMADLPQVVPAEPPHGCGDVNEALVAGHGDLIRQIVFGKDQS